MPDRYHRQTLLPQIGVAGQERLSHSRVLLVGCGALGTVVAEQLVRAGVGFVRIVDRDVVELTNLQRQTLYDQSDADGGVAKVEAAARRLGAINPEVCVEPIASDVWAGNVEDLADAGRGRTPVDCIVDGTDNVQTRYLINDVAVKHGIPWVYGGCVGTEGRVLRVRPGQTPCLRCLFPQPPVAQTLPTCDTAGVLGPAAAIVASLQVVTAMQLLTGQDQASPAALMAIDAWTGRWQRLEVSEERNADCPCCGERRFPFLDERSADAGATLCGRRAVQIRPSRAWDPTQLVAAQRRLNEVGNVTRGRFFHRCRLHDPAEVTLTLFEDGRLVVEGVDDPARARAICARYVGT